MHKKAHFRVSVSTLCLILWWLLTSTILQVHELEKGCGLLPRHGQPHPAGVGSRRCTLVPSTSAPIPFSLPRWQEEEVSLGNIDCTPPVENINYSENLPHWFYVLYSHPKLVLPIVQSSQIGSAYCTVIPNWFYLLYSHSKLVPIVQSSQIGSTYCTVIPHWFCLLYSHPTLVLPIVFYSHPKLVLPIVQSSHIGSVYCTVIPHLVQMRI